MIIHEAANRVVRLRIGEEDCVLRMPLLDDAQLRVDRRSEQAALAAAGAAGLAPHVLACDPASGVLITRWIDEPVWTPERARSPENIELIGALLRRLHRVPAPPKVRVLDLVTLINGYWETILARGIPVARQFQDQHEVIRKLLQERGNGRQCLCHNDLHAGNIIGSGNSVRLLDWEYSGLGEPLFDLASYSQSNNLTDEQCETLLSAYGATNEARQRFAVERQLFDWVSVLWLAASEAPRTTQGAERFDRLLRRFAVG